MEREQKLAEDKMAREISPATSDGYITATSEAHCSPASEEV